MVKYRGDIIGKQFGMLTPYEQTDDYISPQGKHLAKFKCKCSCGNPNDIIVSKNALITGNTISCGCIKSENARQMQWALHALNKEKLL